MGNLGDNSIIGLFYALSVVLPILLAVWVIRTLSAMADAQRQMAAQLAGIATALREISKRPVT